jgi:hypothetical protein
VTTSIPPPINNSGNTKFIVIGAVLVVGGIAAAVLAMKDPPTPPTPPRPPVAQDAGPARITPTIGSEITLSEEEPDAAVEPPAQDASAPHVRYVVRYVDQCPGSIDNGRVDALLAGNQGGFRECYNRELRTNPTLRGGASVRFTINPNGTVGEISTGGIVRSGPFKSCFETTLRRMRFPPPRGGCFIKETRFNFTAS